MAEVSLGHVGAVFGLEVSWLARNNRDGYQLLDLCARMGTLILMLRACTTHAGLNDRLLLGLRA
jgi:DNA invertase Pin-like site-specific DNA recombinase